MKYAVNYGLIALLLIAVMASFQYLNIDLGLLFAADGMSQMASYANGFFSPDFSAEHWRAIGKGALETLAMSSIGTLLAAVLGLLLALPAAGRFGVGIFGDAYRSCDYYIASIVDSLVLPASPEPSQSKNYEIFGHHDLSLWDSIFSFPVSVITHLH